MKVQILVDNPKSWIVPYARKLEKILVNKLHLDACFLDKHEEVTKGDVLVLLSCEKIFKRLDLNRHNLVVHESYLPKGKGWSPLTWQILEGENEIPVTLFEAASSVDSGDIYEQEKIILNGTELLTEIKHKQGMSTISLILKFLSKYPNVEGMPQKGNSTYFRKRTQDDSEMDLNKTLGEQFNLLRVCDNERYPAFFIKNGVKYFLKIYKG